MEIRSQHHPKSKREVVGRVYKRVIGPWDGTIWRRRRFRGVQRLKSRLLPEVALLDVENRRLTPTGKIVCFLLRSVFTFPLVHAELGVLENNRISLLAGSHPLGRFAPYRGLGPDGFLVISVPGRERHPYFANCIAALKVTKFRIRRRMSRYCATVNRWHCSFPFRVCVMFCFFYFSISYAKRIACGTCPFPIHRRRSTR